MHTDVAAVIMNSVAFFSRLEEGGGGGGLERRGA